MSRYAHALVFTTLIAGGAAHADAPREPPLTIALAGPVKPGGGEVELVLEIQRPTPDATPLAVVAQVPDGVTLIGLPRGPIVDEASRTLRYPLRIVFADTPRENLVVSVSTRAASYGARAVATYRFGRTPPPLSRAAFGPVLKGPGGVRLGRPVLVPKSVRMAQALRAAPRVSPNGLDLHRPVGALR